MHEPPLKRAQSSRAAGNARVAYSCGSVAGSVVTLSTLGDVGLALSVSTLTCSTPT